MLTPRTSHLPFTVSARRLVALQATLLEWSAALAPYESANNQKEALYFALNHCICKCRDVIIELSTAVPSTRAELVHELVIMSTRSLWVTLDRATEITGNRRTARQYLSSFVSEGWVLRGKPGVFKLNIP